MASLFNNFAKSRFADGTFEWDTNDMRILLVDSTTTVDTEANVTSLSGYTTLGELSGTGYARKSLTGRTVVTDQANNRSELDADDVLFTNIDAGTTIGMLIFKFVDGTAANDQPIAFSQFSVPIVTNLGNLTLPFDVEGLLQLA